MDLKHYNRDVYKRQDTGVTEIQSVLYDAVGTRPLCAVGAVRLDIPNVGTLILDEPVAVICRVAYFQLALRIA